MKELQDAKVQLRLDVCGKQAEIDVLRLENGKLDTAVRSVAGKDALITGKDDLIKSLTDSVSRLKQEKQTWQAMFGCQVGLDTDKFSKLMATFDGTSSGGSA